MNKAGMKPYVLDAIITRNEKVDRPEQDWNDNKGRAVVDDDNTLASRIFTFVNNLKSLLL